MIPFSNRPHKPLALVIGVAFVLLIGLYLFFGKPRDTGDTISRNMQTAITELNKGLPKMVDSITRLDSVTLTHHRLFNFNYALLAVDRHQFDSLSFLADVKKNWISNMKDHPDTFFKRNHLDTAFVYRDSSGQYVCRLFIKGDEYP